MNRRVIISITAVVVMLMSFAAFQTPTQATPNAEAPCNTVTGIKGIVVVASLKLRAKPSTTETQVGLLAANDVIQVIGRNGSGTWVLVQTPGGISGWAGATYIVLIGGHFSDLAVLDSSSSAADLATLASDANVTKGVIVANVLSIRTKPDSSSAQLGSLLSNDVVTVIGRNSTGTWFQVTNDADVTGWVASAYVFLLKGTMNDLPVTDNSVAPAPTIVPTEVATESATAAATAAPCVPATSAPGVTLKGIVIASVLKLRSKPSITAPAIESLKSGDTVAITARNAVGTWLQVVAPDGNAGWVGSAYIQFTSGHLNDLKVIDSADLSK